MRLTNFLSTVNYLYWFFSNFLTITIIMKSLWVLSTKFSTILRLSKFAYILHSLTIYNFIEKGKQYLEILNEIFGSGLLYVRRCDEKK